MIPGNFYNFAEMPPKKSSKKPSKDPEPLTKIDPNLKTKIAQFVKENEEDLYRVQKPGKWTSFDHQKAWEEVHSFW